ncbi:MAG: HlyD family efflux transporter periplasmic adaptor subunit [Alphaproteobacteria bacterium]|nr:HlyD family efflux transporter periplasmic adaptor subunit [Alphaproteobacteria bacterium]
MPDDSRLELPLASSATFERSGGVGRRVRQIVRGIIVLVTVLVLLAWAGNWAFTQWSQITETDARITTDQIAVSSRVSGWVTELPVIEGDSIAVDNLLIAIDAREATLKLDELDARLLAIGSQRAQISAETAMVDAQTRSRREAATSRVKAAQAGVAASREQRDLARKDFERIKALSGSRVVSQQRLDQTRNALSLSEERYQVAVANLATARADTREAEADRQQIQVNESLLDNLRFQEAQIASERDRQVLDIEDRTIRSPLNGVVSRTFIDKGEFVRPGQRLMLIHDPDNIWVEANIKETELRHLEAGMPVKLRVDAFPDHEFSGTVERIGQAATSEFALLPNPNPSGNFTKVTQRVPIRISVKQEDAMLRPGMLVVVEIDIPGR